MKKFFGALLVIVLVAALGAGGFLYYKSTTPEFALAVTIADVRKNGLEGLKKHLTEDTRKQVEWAEDQLENSFISGLLSSVIDVNQMQELKNEMDQINWEVKDFLKGKEGAEAQLKFNYKDSVTGTVSINMQKVDKKWKISGIDMPSFDKIFF